MAKYRPRVGRLIDEATAEKMQALADRTHEMASVARSRWYLAIAVGNGAGVVATAGKILQNSGAALAGSQDRIPLPMLLPTCWLFFIGLVLAGVASGVEYGRAAVLADLISKANRQAHTTGTTSLPDWFGLWEDGGLILADVFVFAGAVCFIAAIARPLWLLTMSVS